MTQICGIRLYVNQVQDREKERDVKNLSSGQTISNSLHNLSLNDFVGTKYSKNLWLVFTYFNMFFFFFWKIFRAN